MRWELYFRLALLHLLANFQWTCAAAVTSTTEPSVSAEVEETTEGAILENWEHPRQCYVEKSKVDELIVQMNSTVRVLNRDEEYLQCGEKLKAVIVEADSMEFCPEERIRRVQKDLFEVAGGLFKLAVRLMEPSPEEVRSLDLKKVRLILDLNALLVFYGPSPCDSHSIALFPFASLVEHLEWNLDQIFVLFQTTRPTRPPPPKLPPKPAPTSKPTVEDMLNPEKSLSELTEMARLNPTTMSSAVSQIIPQRYSERAENFNALLTFVERLPTAENKVFGFSALYDAIRRDGPVPDVSKLVKLATSVKNLHEIASSSPKFLDTAAWSKLADLFSDLSPLNLIGEKSECQVTNVAYGTQLTTTDHSWPESAYVYQDQSSNETLQIYSTIRAEELVFRIYKFSSNFPFFASDTNTNTNSYDNIHQTKPSERYILRNKIIDLPANAEIDWKLVPVPDKVNQFRILSVKFHDFMFAHDTATGRYGWRRVLLGRKTFGGHDHVTNADIWEFNC